MPWRQAGALAALLGGVAMAAMPRATSAASSQELQWQALAIAPLSAGARTGMRLVATASGRADRLRARPADGRAGDDLWRRRFDARAARPRRRDLCRCRERRRDDRRRGTRDCAWNAGVGRARAQERRQPAGRAHRAPRRAWPEPRGRPRREWRAAADQAADPGRHPPVAGPRPGRRRALLVAARGRRVAAIGRRISPRARDAKSTSAARSAPTTASTW